MQEKIELFDQLRDLGAVDITKFITAKEDMLKRYDNGALISREDALELVTKILSKNKLPYEVIYTEDMFKEDIKKYHPSKEGMSWCHRSIVTLSLVGSSNPADKPISEASKFLLEKYGENTFKMYESFYGKITYCVFNIVKEIFSKYKPTYNLVKLYTIGLRAHARRHSKQNEYLTSIADEIYNTLYSSPLMESLTAEELKTVAPPTEYDALAEELLAIQDYVKEL